MDKSNPLKSETHRIKVGSLGGLWAIRAYDGKNIAGTALLSTSHSKSPRRLVQPMPSEPALFIRGDWYWHRPTSRKPRTESVPGEIRYRAGMKPELMPDKKVPSYAKVPEDFLPCVSVSVLHDVVNQIAPKRGGLARVHERLRTTP